MYTRHRTDYVFFCFMGDSRERLPMPNKQPPIEHRFSKTNPPPPQKVGVKRGTYLVPLLKRFLNKTIKFEDPETRKMITGKVKDAVIWRLLLNATQGENVAIKEILDRTDGKTDIVIDNSQHHITYQEVKIAIDRNADISSSRKAGNRIPSTEQV